jgi:hypothetical protein
MIPSVTLRITEDILTSKTQENLVLGWEKGAFSPDWYNPNDLPVDCIVIASPSDLRSSSNLYEPGVYDVVVSNPWA